MFPDNQKPLKKRTCQYLDKESSHNTVWETLKLPDYLKQDCERRFPAAQREVHLRHSRVPEAGTVPHVPAENSSDLSVGKGDKFQIQDITGHGIQSTSKESEKPCIEQNDSAARSESTFIELKNLSSFPYTPGYSMQLMSSRFPLGANVLNDSSGLFNTCFTVTNHGFPGEVPNCPTICSHPLVVARQLPFSSMHPSNHKVEHGVEKKRRIKGPFNEINIPDALKYSGISQSELDLELALSSTALYSSSHAKDNSCKLSTVRAVMKPSTRQNSTSTFNSFSGIPGESMLQDTNKMPNCKKNCQIPEIDEKYLEKRRKNNLAAKKSRLARKKKAASLAIINKILHKKILKIEADINRKYRDLAFVRKKLEMASDRLDSFRKICEGNAKEAFEQIFQLYLPQQ